MQALLGLSKAIDKLNDRFGWLAEWGVLLACLVCAANSFARYSPLSNLHVYGANANAFLEVQWYLFAAVVMLGASQVLRVNEHVRVDVLYGRYASKTKVYIDLFGLIFFLLPVMIAMVYLSYPLFYKMLTTGEMSSQAGGLIRWPAMLMLPLGFSLLILQGLSEIIKRVGWLAGKHEFSTQYERPLQ